MLIIWHWIQVNWFSVLTTAVIIEQAVKAEAEKRNNVKLISICDHIGSALGFIGDVIRDLITKKAVTGQKVD